MFAHSLSLNPRYFYKILNRLTRDCEDVRAADSDLVEVAIDESRQIEGDILEVGDLIQTELSVHVLPHRPDFVLT